MVEFTSVNWSGPAEEAPTWGDYGDALVSGVHGVDAMANAMGRWLSERAGDTEGEQHYAAHQQLANMNAQDRVAGMTPGGRRRLQAEVLSGEFWSHPISSTMLKATATSPTVAAAVIPALALPGPGWVATVGVAMTGGAMTMGQALDEMYQLVDEAPEDKLMAIPYYAGLRSMGMSEAEARRDFAATIRGNKHLYAFALGAATNSFGSAGQIARVARGQNAALTGGTTRLGRIGHATGEGVVSEFAEEAGGNALVQNAAVEGGLQQNFDVRKMINAGLEGSVASLPFSLASGAASRGPRTEQPTPQPSVDPQNIPTNQVTGRTGIAPQPAQNVPVGDPQNGGTRSETEYPKEETRPQPVPTPTPATPELPAQVTETAAPVAKRKGRPKKQAPAQATNGIAPDQAAALAALNPKPPEPPVSQEQAVAQVVETAASDTNVNRSPAQEEAENFRMGDLSLHGINLKISFPRDTPRNGTTAPDHYGHVPGTVSGDGAPVDVWIGPNPAADRAFVIDQVKDGTREFDEHKVMLGYDTREQALAAYQKSFADGRGADRFGGISDIHVDELKAWLGKGGGKKPYGQINAPSVQQPVTTTRPRILPDLSDTSKAHQLLQNKQVRQNIKDSAPKEVVEAKPGERLRHDSKANKERIAKDRASADQLLREFPPSPDEDPAAKPGPKASFDAGQALVKRARAIVAKAQELGIKIPQKVYASQSDAMAWLAEAAKLARVPTPKNAKTFAERDRLYRAGMGEQARAERKAEGDLAMRRDQVGADQEVGGTIRTTNVDDSPEDILIRQQELERRAREAEEVGATFDPDNVSTVSDEELPAQQVRPVERLTGRKPYLSKERLEEIKKRAREAGAKFDDKSSEVRKGEVTDDAKRAALAQLELAQKRGATPRIDPTESASALEGKKDEFDQVPFDTTGEIIKDAQEKAESIRLAATMSGDLSQLFEATKGDLRVVKDDVVSGKLARALYPDMMRRIGAAAGNTEVHILPDHSFNSFFPESFRAVYLAVPHMIVMRESVYNSPGIRLQTALHEGVHAAFKNAMWSSPSVLKTVKELYVGTYVRYAEQQHPENFYGFKDMDEFIAEAFSNPKFQEYLASVKLPPRAITRLGLDARARSVWDLFVEVVRRVLGLPSAHGTALHAVMRVGAQLEMRAAAFAAPASREAVDAMLSGVSGLESALATSALKGEAAEFVRDQGSAVANWVKRNVIKILTGDQMRQTHAGKFVDDKGDALDQLWKSVAAQQPTMDQSREEYEKLGQRFIELKQKNATEAQEFAELGTEARFVDVNLVDGVAPSAIVTHKSNKHLGKDATAGWQAKARLPELQRRYLAMSPEARKLWQDMVKYYRDTHNEMVTGSIAAILDPEISKVTLTPSELTDITTRTMDGKLTDTDKTKLGETIFRLLKNARDFRAVLGTYFPLMRYGDHVVRTTDKITDTKGGVLVEPDTVEFKSKSNVTARRAAEAFVKSSDLVHLDTEKVYFDTNTGKQVTFDQSKSLNDVTYGYRVKMQTDGAYFFESRAAAEKFARDNPEGHDVVSKPEDRMGMGYHAHNLSGTQMLAMMGSIEARTDLSDATKNLLRTVLTQASARMLSGNRISSRRLQAKKVTGASEDFARNVLQYGHAASRHLALTKYMPHVRDALRRMQGVIDAKAADKNTDRNELVQILNEVKQRIDQGTIEPNEPGKFMRDLFTLSFLARLFSPAYSVINATQVAMVTLPVLGGRFHNSRAVKAIGQAYSDIGLGDSLLAGVTNTYKAAKQIKNAGLLGTDDIVGNIRTMLGKASDGKELTQVFDYLVETNAISQGAGFEISSAISEGRGKWGSGLAKVDRIARQLPIAIEAINRTVTAVAAYRLARQGMSHEKAMEFALNTTKNTQGDYSAANAPRFFNKTALRPALQFKKYAQMMTYLVGDMMYRAFKDADPEERKIAIKQLANIVAVQIAMAGALSLPGLELVKIPVMVAGMLGIGGGWDDVEERLKKLAEQTFGKHFGRMITSGVITRALGDYGIDVSQRMSLADLWLFGEPRKNDAESTQAYMFRLATGAPGSLVLDYMQATRDLAGGQWAKALDKVFPVKFLSDTTKAIHRYSDRKETEYEVGLNAFGFRSARQAEQGREIGSRMRSQQGLEERYRRLSREYIEAASAGERVRLRTEIIKHNNAKNEQGVQTPLRYRIFPNALDRARGRREREELVR